MEKEIIIPEGYNAKIEGNKVVFIKKESEDERIREAIESIIRVYGKTHGEWIDVYDMDTLVVRLRDAFAYLEKQKEQEPDGNITDEEMKQAMDDVHNFKIAVTDMAKTFNIKIDHNRDIDWHNFCASLLTYLKRHAEWSKEDKKMLEAIVGDIHCGADFNAEVKREANKREKWLRALAARLK